MGAESVRPGVTILSLIDLVELLFEGGRETSRPGVWFFGLTLSEVESRPCPDAFGGWALGFCLVCFGSTFSLRITENTGQAVEEYFTLDVCGDIL